MTDDLLVFRDLVLWLWQTHQKPWEYENDNAQLIVESFGLEASSFFADTELEACLPSEDRVDIAFPENRYFYLSPITESRIMVPRIHLTCNFGRNIPEIRCRLELFLLDDNLEIQSLGYRYEAPEGKNDQGAGIHHYYHIQMIQPPTAQEKIAWLPETQPAFPINADDPVKLILNLLISLYGLSYLATILKEASIWKIDEYINGFSCIKFESFQWYRLIEIGDPVKHNEPYTITSNMNEFETYIRGRYPGCNIRGITRSRFDGFSDGEKKRYP